MFRTSYPIALITEVFYDDVTSARLVERLKAAKGDGAELAVLPELPLNSWSPAGRTAVEEDAEAPGGPRCLAQAMAAREVGIALAGGAIVRDPDTGTRNNTALVFSDTGELISTYRKIHLPEEEGFWETSHYEPGAVPPRVVRMRGGPALGIQICSDIQRPGGAQLLAAQGAEVLLVPRATPPGSYERWKLVLRAAALTTASYVISVNRTGHEIGVDIGGPSVVIAPDGEVVLETEQVVDTWTLDLEAIDEARKEYPGYLSYPAGVYAEGWRRLGER